MEQEKAANWGWAAIGGFVLAFEALAPETLSEGVDRAIDRFPWLTRLAIGYTALHLCNALPPKLDIFHQVTNLRRLA